MNPSIIDRLLALAPLGVLAYVLGRHETERREYLRALEADRESFRNERRELLNRLQFPTRMPTGTVPTAAPMPAGVSATAERRVEWGKVGTSALPVFALPGDSDDAPGVD